MTESASRCHGRRRPRPALLAFALLAACAAETPPPAVQVIESADGVAAVVSITGPVDSLPEWGVGDTIATVGGTVPLPIGSVGDVRFLSDGRMLVEDSQARALHLVDATGSPIRTIGRRGEGPGEFSVITTVSVSTGDSILVYDLRLVRVSVFDTTGVLVRDVPIERNERAGSIALNTWSWGPARMAVQRAIEIDTVPTAGVDTPRQNRRDALISLVDAAGHPDGPEVRFPGGFYIAFRGDMGSPFSPRPIVAVGADRIVYGSGDAYELVVAGPALQTLRTIRWNGWGGPLTSTIVDSVRAATVAGLGPAAQSAPQMVDLMLTGMYSPESLPERIPALGAVHVGPDGSIWVSRFALIASEWDEQTAWHVLDPDGRPVAHLRLPPRSRLVAVANDRVAVVSRDDLDVESVRVFRLVKD